MSDSSIHLDDTWLETFTRLRMTAFGQTVIDIANDVAYDEWTFSQKIAFALDKEVAARSERRFAKLLKASQSPNPDACVEELDYRPDRNLARRVNDTVSSLSMGSQGHQRHGPRQIIGGENLSGLGVVECYLSAGLHRPVLPD